MEIAVNQDNLALAIGSRGQNIRLASQLVGWELNIISSEEAEAKVKVDETEFMVKLIDSLAIEESIAEKIISVGLASFDDIAYVDNSVLEAFVDNADEIERIKSSAEDAALMEAMGAITEEEENLIHLVVSVLAKRIYRCLQTKELKIKMILLNYQLMSFKISLKLVMI